jgi:hypothetical protein
VKILLIVWIVIMAFDFISWLVDIALTIKLIKLKRDWEAAQNPRKTLPKGFWRLWRKE